MSKFRKTGHRSTREARIIETVVKAAGGRVEYTRDGHLRVFGPVGMAVVGSKLGDRQRWQNARTTIRRNTGIDISL